MPGLSSQEHLKKARDNSKFARSLQGSALQHPEWVVVGAFYSALHYINAYLTSVGLEAGNHSKRMWYVSTIASLRPIQREYLRLTDKAWKVRYATSNITESEAQTLLDLDLNHIEANLWPPLP